MKKFLTVLLVIAVMFTFSFGSAFAATPAASVEKLQAAKTLAESLVDRNYDAAMKLVTDADSEIADKTGDPVVAGMAYPNVDDAKLAAAWAKIDVKAVVKAEIAKEYQTEAKDSAVDANDAFGNYNADAALYAMAVFGLSTKKDATTAAFVDQLLAAKIIEVAGTEAAKNMYDADRADILSALDKVNYSVYSSTAVEPESGKTYLVLAQEKIAAAKKEAAKKGVLELDTFKISDVAAGLKAVKDFVLGDSDVDPVVPGIVAVERYLGTANPDAGIMEDIPTGLYQVVGILTASEVENKNITDAATKASLKAKVQREYAAYVVKAGASKDIADAYQTVYNYLIDANVLTEEHQIRSVDLGAPNITDYRDVVAKAADLKTYAEKYKAEKDGTGANVRTAAAVDKIVNDTTKLLYAKAQNPSYEDLTVVNQNWQDAKDAIAGLYTEQVTYNLNFAKEAAKAAVENAYDSNSWNYYPTELAKVDENKAKILADIEAADTATKVETAIGGNTDVASHLESMLFDGIDTAGEVDKDVDFAAGKTAESALAAVKAYIVYANSGKTMLDASYIVEEGRTDAIKDAIRAIYGEAGARTEAARKAVAVSTEAVVAKLSTVGSLAEAKAAAEAAIKALPATITIADKDAIVAAQELVDAYNAMNGHGVIANQSTLNSAITNLKTAMLRDFAVKVAAVNLNDKAAVKALKAEIDDANYLDIFNGAVVSSGVLDTDNLQAALDNIREAERKAVEAAINAIPINVTEADAAVVKAARDLYEAFVEEYLYYGTVYTDAYNPTAKIGNYRDLATAEATIGLNNDDASKVEALKITASSTAKKGSITVKWTVKGDAEAADGYQIWRSTKKSSGFKKFFTTTKKSYKNTKSLKKGTRYYYKVRAYKKVDGKMVYSDWSNKAYRIAK